MSEQGSSEPLKDLPLAHVAAAMTSAVQAGDRAATEAFAQEIRVQLAIRQATGEHPLAPTPASQSVTAHYARSGPVSGPRPAGAPEPSAVDSRQVVSRVLAQQRANGGPSTGGRAR